MEKELGFALFIRQDNTLTPTYAGAQLYEFFSHSRDEFQRLLQQIAERGEQTKHQLRIGCPSNWNPEKFYQPIVEYFSARHPNVKLTIECFPIPEMINMLKNRQLDMVLMLSLRDLNPLELSSRQIAATQCGILYSKKSFPQVTSICDLRDTQFLGSDSNVRELFETMISTARQFAGCIVAGAEGIEMGSAFMTTVEAPIHPNAKQAVVNARDIDIVSCGECTGEPSWQIRNALADRLLQIEANHPRTETAQLLMKAAAGSLGKAAGQGDTDGLPIQQINRLLDDEYLPDEFGLFGLPDGGSVFSNLTDMPGVTPEMFDWWFAWHGLDSMRYTIWDKDDHYYCQTQNVVQALDDTLTMKQRYWNTTHDIREALADNGPILPVRLTFVPPETIGFDPERLKDFKGSIVCTPGRAIMIHFVRPTPTGSELRTRFYSGYMTTPEGIVRVPDFKPNDFAARALLLHNIKEFTHLAKILPSVYAEFKDDFRIGLE